MNKSLISDEYRAMITKIHSSTIWGRTAANKHPHILKYAAVLNTTTMLDYGAGCGGLKSILEEKFPGVFTVIEYEPGRVECSAPPSPQSYVVCVDVLEHVEPEMIDNVLDDIQRVTLSGAYVTIATCKAFKVLPDGRNAHLIVETYDWWIEKIKSRFTVKFEAHDHRGIHLFLTPLKE